MYCDKIISQNCLECNTMLFVQDKKKMMKNIRYFDVCVKAINLYYTGVSRILPAATGQIRK